MITLKITVKETEENHVEVKMITPKDVSKSSQAEKDTAKFVVEKLNEVFEKKEGK